MDTGLENSSNLTASKESGTIDSTVVFLSVMSWLPQSCDLKPIRPVWGEFDQRFSIMQSANIQLHRGCLHTVRGEPAAG